MKKLERIAYLEAKLKVVRKLITDWQDQMPAQLYLMLMSILKNE